MNDLATTHRPMGCNLRFAPLATATTVACIPQVLAFTGFGGGNFFLDTSLRVANDSNRQGSAVAADDTVFTLRPELSSECSGARGCLDFSAGTAIQSYQDNDVFDGGFSRSDASDLHRSISTGLDGALRPTLSENISVGFQRSDAETLDTAGDDNQVLGSVGLTWQTRATTSVSIDASSDASGLGLARAMSSQNLNFAVTQTLSPRFSCTAGAGWTHYTYVGVAGSGIGTVSGNVDLTYSPNQQYPAGIRITVSEQCGDSAFRDFGRNTFSIFGSACF